MKTQKKLTPEQKWEKATLANNFIFYKVMRDHPNACQHLLEILLKIKIEKMEIHNEEVIEIENGAKGIRLDVYVKDTGRIFDIELQVANTEELPERARYYASLMALDSLKSGEIYSELCDSHVVFICMSDIFHNNLPVSTFENICIEDGITKLNDRDYKHFFIAPTCAKMLEDEEVKSFFEFLISNRAKNKYTNDLKNYVTDAKLNMNYKRQFMEWERQRAYDFKTGYNSGRAEGIIAGRKDGLKEGKKQGLEEGKKEGLLEGKKQGLLEGKKQGLLEGTFTVARNAIALNLPAEKISKITGLPIEQIQELIEQQ